MTPLPMFAVLLVVTEPMDDAELTRLAESGDTSGKEFVTVMLDSDYPDHHGNPAMEIGVIPRRCMAQDALAEFGVKAWAFDEYGWKEVR